MFKNNKDLLDNYSKGDALTWSKEDRAITFAKLRNVDASSLNQHQYDNLVMFVSDIPLEEQLYYYKQLFKLDYNDESWNGPYRALLNILVRDEFKLLKLCLQYQTEPSFMLSMKINYLKFKKYLNETNRQKSNMLGTGNKSRRSIQHI